MGQRVLTAVICIVIAGLSFLVLGESVARRFLIGQNDFVQLYAGARFAGTPDLYNIEAQKVIHIQQFGGVLESVYYTRLPFYALLLSPLGQLPYIWAYAIFQAISLVIIAIFLFLYSRLYPDFLVAAALCWPLLISIANGQDVAIVAALAGLSVLLIRRGRSFTAGLLLSLCAIKIHLMILVPLVLIVKRKWTVLQGGLAGGACLLLLSFLGGGAHWLNGFLATVSNPELHPGPEHMPTYHGLWVNLTGQGNRMVELMLSGATALLTIHFARTIKSFDVVFGLSLIAGLLVCFHAYSQDLVMLLAAFGIFATSPASKALRGVTFLVNLPFTCFLLLTGPPISAAAPLLVLTTLLVAAYFDAYAAKNSAPSRLAAA